jgi:ribosomal protein S27AE
MAIEPHERPLLARFSGCIACGRCDVGEAERVASSHGQYPGLMQLVLASTRSMPDYDAAALSFAHVPDGALARKERRCPTAVPFVALAAFVRAKARPRSLAPS